MDTRTLLRERLRRSRDWTQTIDELEKELEASGIEARTVRATVRARGPRRGCDPRARTRSRSLSTRVEAPPRQPQGALARARGVRRDRSLRDGRQARRDGAAYPAGGAEPRADRRRGAARQRAEGQGAADPPARARSDPDSVRVKDALAALDVRPRVLDRRSRPSLRRRRSVRRRAARAHAAARGAHPAHRSSRRTRASKSCSSASSRRTSTSRRRTSCTRRCSPTANRWDELEAHHMRRADSAADHAKRVEALRMFALEWVQRFKDRDRGAKFFDAAIAGDGVATARRR